MNKKALAILVIGMFVASSLYAADGDLIVNGKVGVGTSSPSQKLEVTGGDVLVKGTNSWSTTGDEAKFIMGDTNHYIKCIYGTGIKIGTYQASDGIVLHEGTGKVGIGTSTPSEKLEVWAGDVVVRGANNWTNTGDEAKYIVGDSNHFFKGVKGTGVIIGTWNASNGIVLRESTGNVGLGTSSPDSTLELSGSSAAISLNENTGTPATPASGAECRVYMKADKLVFQYNDAGTVRYKYLLLSGTGVTWVHTTTAP
jgi:hypothetical protein